MNKKGAERIHADIPRYGLPHGIRVEVRPVASECPVAEELRSETQLVRA